MFVLDQAPTSVLTSSNLQLLDNPVWNALNTEHAALAIGDNLARRYPADVSPLVGLAEQSVAAYDALRSLVAPGGAVAQFLDSPADTPAGWELVRGGRMSQMIWSGGDRPRTAPLPKEIKRRTLTPVDVPAMLELTALAEPGPFGPRTRELGEFFGIFAGGRLMAMAGQRLRLPGFVEVSAVCTHPEARGLGYAHALVAEVVASVLRVGATPFLHVFDVNHAAIRVYEGLGFIHRSSLQLAVIKPV